MVSKKMNDLSLVKDVTSLCTNQFLHSPNSCGQVQVADIGIMGAPARKEVDGKNVAVPGCKIFVGGKIGEESHLSLEPVKTGIPLEDLVPELVEILKTEFGAVEK
jgi:ferredoxin-nitrite reductase